MAYKNVADKKAAARRNYLKTKDQQQERNRRTKERLRARLREAKDVPCMDCGIKYPYYVMDLDHRPGENKVSEVAKLVTRGSMVKLEQEIAKCDVVCSNCHRQRTFDRKEA